MIPNYVKTSEEWVNTGTQAVKVFYPTLAEMQNFSAYIAKCENEGACTASGICKIVPPIEWSPRPSRRNNYDDIDDYMIQSPVREKIQKTKISGAYTKINKTYRKELTVSAFRELALSEKYANPRPDISLKELEKFYWRNITAGDPIYGADTPGSCYEDSVEEFNLNKLGTILDILKEDNVKIPGVNSTYLYFGMYKTTFPWHCEDCDLYSINYIHFGEPKFWYGIPPSEATKFERLCKNKFPEESASCPAYLRHKTFLVSIRELRQHGIDYGTMVQYPGEFMITFPKGYHCGFNVGYNCAESTNFALERWIDYGKEASVCRCVKGSVELDLRPFMRTYRPQEFEKWHAYWYEKQPVIQIKKGENLPKKQTSKSETSEVDETKIEKEKFDSFMNTMAVNRLDYEYLFHHQHDFKEEINFNKHQANSYPYCSICQNFVPLLEGKTKYNRNAESIRYAVDAFFDKTKSEYNVLPLESDRTVVCKRCSVVVHPSCYHINPAVLDLNSSSDADIMILEESFPAKKRRVESWTCRRCAFSREPIVCASTHCDLCPLRGGAFIPYGSADGSSFVHVVCAIMSRRTRIIRESNFVMYAISLPSDWASDITPESRPEQIGISSEYLFHDFALLQSRFPEQESKFCAFCERDLDQGFVRCLPCFDNNERALFFHPSCCSLAGLTFEYRHFPLVAAAVCRCHVESDNKPSKYPLAIGDLLGFVAVNETVDVVKLLEKQPTEYATIEFLDSTVSTDVVIAQDVVDCHCKYVNCGGNHLYGWIVRVKWDEDELFDGYFRQTKADFAYTVKSQKTSERMVCSKKPLVHRNQPKSKQLEKLLKQYEAFYKL
ncbi:[histone H3]-trimethyl-L-lysine(9) demethylase [Aphelenchoides besseyi]|nr:[histone H3]-trimethyl-L-lysine(9) demethylase [Aphelenchoides besseyi]